MRKITSESDYAAVNAILQNFYDAHPVGDEFQLMTPREVVNDHDLYLAVLDYMKGKGLIQPFGSSKFIISDIGIEVVDRYEGDVRKYFKRSRLTFEEDQAMVHQMLSGVPKKEVKKKNKNWFWENWVRNIIICLIGSAIFYFLTKNK